VLAKLLLASTLGGAIGLEREIAGKSAGLRTNILICVGAALFTQLSIEIAKIGFSPDGHPYGDTTRIAAQVVSGVGFLGAGAILHAQGSIVGLTTAATIWVVAAVGVAVGAGAYLDAIGSAALIILVLIGLRPVERWIAERHRRAHATVRMNSGVAFAPVERAIGDLGIQIVSCRAFDRETHRVYELDLSGATRRVEELADALRARDEILSVTLD
jgi:putative Mg2+ transporter-C (MgtC) family protein